MKIFILAGNMREAQLWAKDGQIARKEWVYISGVYDLRGRDSNFILARVGTYYNRRDLNDITEALDFIRAIHK